MVRNFWFSFSAILIFAFLEGAFGEEIVKLEKPDRKDVKDVPVFTFKDPSKKEISKVEKLDNKIIVGEVVDTTQYPFCTVACIKIVAGITYNLTECHPGPDAPHEVSFLCSGTLTSENTVTCAQHCVDKTVILPALQQKYKCVNDTEVLHLEVNFGGLDDPWNVVETSEFYNENPALFRTFNNVRPWTVFLQDHVVILSNDFTNSNWEMHCNVTIPYCTPGSEFVAQDVLICGCGRYIDATDSKSPRKILCNKTWMLKPCLAALMWLLAGVYINIWYQAAIPFGNGACNGDSGGPMFLQTKNGKYCLGGTTSFALGLGGVLPLILPITLCNYFVAIYQTCTNYRFQLYANAYTDLHILLSDKYK